jgi:ABC-type nitrate/sulfonate/bicarbonate transport system substrate-binding protein
MRLKKSFVAALCGACLWSSAAALAADKITAGAIGAASGTLWPYYVGVSQGFFQAEGVDLDIVFAPSSAATIQQLAAGSLDLAATTGLADPIHAIDKGAAIAVLRIHGQSVPYELMAKPEIKRLEDLKGKTISLGGIADITRIYFDRMAGPHGVTPGQYDMVFAGATSARFSALKSGAVDAAILLPPFNFIARKAGFGSLGLTMDYVKQMPFTGIIVSRSWAGGHAPLVQRFLAAYTKSVEWFYADANRDAAIDIYVKASQTPRDEVAESYDFFRKIEFFERTGKVSRAGLNNLLAALKGLGEAPSASLTVDQLIMPGLTELAD